MQSFLDLACKIGILEFNWFKRFGKEKSCFICRQIFASSTQLQNWSFHVVVRMTTAVKCTKMKRSSRECKIEFFLFFSLLNMKFVTFLSRVRSWLLSFSNISGRISLRKGVVSRSHSAFTQPLTYYLKLQDYFPRSE